MRTSWGAIPRGPWVPFLGFFLTNSLLVYPPAFPWRPLVLAVGWGLPAFYLWKKWPSAKSGGPKGPLDAESFSVPWPLLLLLFSIAFALRMSGLTSLFLWPSLDEATRGFLALCGNMGSEGGFFRGFNQSPPTYISLIGLLLGWTHSPLFSLWFPPALASALCVPMGYWAARTLFPRSLSFLIASGFTLGYWPLLSGRIGLDWSLLLLWICLSWWCWGWFQGVPRERILSRLVRAFLLGSVLGAGSLVCTTWSIFAFGMTLLVLGSTLRERSGRGPLGAYAIGFLLALTPFLRALTREEYGGHILASSLSGGTGLLGPLRMAKDYFGCFFWPVPAAYIPQEMGFLNPLAGSLFGVGLLALARNWKDVRGKVFFQLVLLWTLPALFFSVVEPFRLFQLLPLILLAIAVGIQTLLGSIPKAGKGWVALALVAVSGAWDLGRLIRPYRDVPGHPGLFSTTGKSLEKFQAFWMVSDLSAGSGPGFFFAELVPDSTDMSLAYMTLPADAREFPVEPSPSIRWLAFLAPVHDLPSMVREFPGLRGNPLPSQVPGRMSDRFLAVLPLHDGDLASYKDWWPAFRVFWQADFLVTDLSNGRSRKGILDLLKRSYPALPKEPFLQSCFFEKLLYHYAWERTFHPEDSWASWENFSGVFTSAYRQSYRDDVLRKKFGELMAMEGRPGPETSKLP
ncbi:MAG TPA: hypothetical protein VHE12_04785 [bacterium]|nr:hypothetical protein [bacterium]